MAGYIESDGKGKPTTKITLSGKDISQIRQRNQKLYSQAKAKRIWHYQNRFTTNVKGTYVGGKHERRKRPAKQTPNKKMVIEAYMLIIILNVNGLKVVLKDTE